MKATTKGKLKELGVRPRKERGQNFLQDRFVLERIAAFGKVVSGESILEIGPGLGALTEMLAPLGRLTAVEIEPQFCSEISKRFPEVKVICDDFCRLSLERFGGKLVVYGNIPYSASSEIVLHIVSERQHVSRAILMVQKEFAERLAAKPGGKEYGSLSVALQVHAKVELGEIIPGSAFHPEPAVESQIVKIDFSKPPELEIGDLRWFERVVRASFHQRRKKISNTLRSLGSVTAEGINAALAEAGIDSSRRAETVSVAEFAALARALASKTH